MSVLVRRTNSRQNSIDQFASGRCSVAGPAVRFNVSGSSANIRTCRNDGVDEATQRLRGFRAGLWLLQSLCECGDLLAVHPGHLRVQQRRNVLLRRDTRFENASAGPERAPFLGRAIFGRTPERRVLQ